MRISLFVLLGVSIAMIGGCACSHPLNITMRIHHRGLGMGSRHGQCVAGCVGECDSCDNDSNTESATPPEPPEPSQTSNVQINDPLADVPEAALYPAPRQPPFEYSTQASGEYYDENEANDEVVPNQDSADSQSSVSHSVNSRHSQQDLSRPIASLELPKHSRLLPISVLNSDIKSDGSSPETPGDSQPESTLPENSEEILKSSTPDLPAARSPQSEPVTTRNQPAHRASGFQAPIRVADSRGLDTHALRPIDLQAITAAVHSDWGHPLLVVPGQPASATPGHGTALPIPVGATTIVRLHATTPVGESVPRPSTATIALGSPKIVHGTHLLAQPILDEQPGFEFRLLPTIKSGSVQDSLRRLTVRPTNDSKK